MIEIKSSDQRFYDSPDAGDPDCRCSRCGLAIGEETVPIRCCGQNEAIDPGYEYRFHPRCLGFVECPDEPWEPDEGAERFEVLEE